MRRQFAVIGLGRFGTSVARTLFHLGQEVLAVDINEDRLRYVSEEVTSTAIADTTDVAALKSIGIRNFDVAVVAIGGDVQANIMTTLLLKDQGVPLVVAKALNKMQGRVLEKVGADRVVYPEREMGKRVAHSLVCPNLVDYIEIAAGYRVEEMVAPRWMHGKTLGQMELRKKHGVTAILIRHADGTIDFSPGADGMVREGDILVLAGAVEDLDRLEQKD
ncbi:MAG: TrkA family potassium uptake protein [Firmicutes bacterium]|nr:TrkA family potassium uptake protein [Bacillota bacterium]